MDDSTLSDDEVFDLLCKIMTSRPHLAPKLARWLIPEHTLAPASAITENRHRGIIKLFDQQKGYGFISCPEMEQQFGSDVWLHSTQIGAFTKGEYVEFAALLGKNGKPQAFGLTWPEDKKGSAAGAVPPFQAEQPFQPVQPFQRASIQPFQPPPIFVPQGPSAKKPKTQGPPAKAQAPGVAGPLDDTRRYLGTIKENFDPLKGFGFIDCPELREVTNRDTWLHGAQMQDFQPGELVEFTMVVGKAGQPQAIDLSYPGCPPLQVSSPHAPQANPYIVQGPPSKKPRTQGPPVAQAAAAGPLDSTRRYIGTIKDNFDPQKGFGFIDCPEIREVTNRDTWLHGAQVQDFQPGELVEFTMVYGSAGQPQAIDLSYPGFPPLQVISPQVFATPLPTAKGSGKGLGIGGEMSMASSGKGIKVGTPPAAVSDLRYVGRVKSWAAEKGFGFIECEDLYPLYGRDVYVHHAQIKHFGLGDAVSFTMALNRSGQPQALDLDNPEIFV